MIRYGTTRVILALLFSLLTFVIAFKRLSQFRRGWRMALICFMFFVYGTLFYLIPFENMLGGFNKFEIADNYQFNENELLFRLDGNESSFVIHKHADTAEIGILTNKNGKWYLNRSTSIKTCVYESINISCDLYHAQDTTDYYLVVYIHFSGMTDYSVEDSNGKSFEGLSLITGNQYERTIYISEVEYSDKPYYITIDGEQTADFKLSEKWIWK